MLLTVCRTGCICVPDLVQNNIQRIFSSRKCNASKILQSTERKRCSKINDKACNSMKEKINDSCAWYLNKWGRCSLETKPHEWFLGKPCSKIIYPTSKVVFFRYFKKELMLSKQVQACISLQRRLGTIGDYNRQQTSKAQGKISF